MIEETLWQIFRRWPTVSLAKMLRRILRELERRAEEARIAVMS